MNINTPFHCSSGFIGDGPMASMVQNLDPIGRAAYQGINNAILRSAFERQGAYALGSSRIDAAAHEAGHAIYNTATGSPVTRVSIRPARIPAEGRVAGGGGTYWVGLTEGGWCVSPDTDPSDDMDRVRDLLAGFYGERQLLGDRLRLGSAADERTTAMMIAGFTAMKLGADGLLLLGEQAAIVAEILRINDAPLRAVTRLLERDRRIRGDRLARLLADVEPFRVITTTTAAATDAMEFE
ncbi:hypothetical protein [Bosea sp. NBC_00550]|uniref:hypothetical protein n=1 Tax=Bosea sp. NBC_00550 TaxID=2969621 RepID=UPI00222E5059|nr:hypothetical protein [Bosea sp. NBC_00550]UZF93014.1 hypothetical protein NWE53_02010 [Bosea sp. NBC_00550]